MTRSEFDANRDLSHAPRIPPRPDPINHARGWWILAGYCLALVGAATLVMCNF